MVCLRIQRIQRATLHVLIVAFGLGYLGVSLTTCELGFCDNRLKAMMGLAMVGTCCSVITTIALLVNCVRFAQIEWILDLCVAPVWAASVGITMYTVEGLYTISAPTLVAFSWLALSLLVLACASATLGNDGPQKHGVQLFDLAVPIQNERLQPNLT